MAADLHIERRLFHMLVGSMFPVAALYLEEGLLLLLLLTAATAMVAGDAARLMIPFLNRLIYSLFGRVLRESEKNRVTGASYMILGTLGSFAIFPRDVAVLAVLFTSVGDPVAGLVGVRASGWRVFGKSPLGSAAMAVAGLGVAGLLHAAGEISFGWTVVAGALAAAVVELLPLRVDDNLRVPLASGAVMVVLGM